MTTYSFSPDTTCADVMEEFMRKLMKPKTRIEVCEIITHTDLYGREVEIFYRVIDAPKSPQTDDIEDCYDIEQVTYKGKKVKLSSMGEQDLYDFLNLINSEKI